MQSPKHGYRSNASTGIHIPTQSPISINKQNKAFFYNILEGKL
jgi:hypothetical protein